MVQGPYRFRDPAGVDWVAIVYRDCATRFAHEDRPGRWTVAFLRGVEEGEPLFEIRAPEEIPDPPPAHWLLRLLESARALKQSDEAVPA